MKRIALVFALVAGAVSAGAGTAGAADSNVGVQLANITQTALASAPALQVGGGFASANFNSSHASSTNYASITQWLSQFNY